MAREGVFNIHAKGYPEAYHGTELKYQQGVTVAEAIQLGHFENEEALIRAAYGQFNIRMSAAVKEGAAAGKTKDELASILQNGKLLAEAKKGGGGGNPEALAAARAAREAAKAAKAHVDSIEQRAAKDPAFALQWAKLQKMMMGAQG